MLDNNTSLYFYSAVFQGNMALLALVGVFVVFKLQVLSSALQRKDDLIISFVEDFCTRKHGVVHDFLWDLLRSLDDFQTKFEEKLNDPNYKPTIKPDLQVLQKSPALSNHFEDRRQIIEAQEKIIRKIKFPFGITLGVIAISLVLLPLSITLHIHFASLEVFAIVATVVTNIISLLIRQQIVEATRAASDGRLIRSDVEELS